MKVGDKVVIVSRDIETIKDTHCFNVGQICEIVRVDDSLNEFEYVVKGYFEKSHNIVRQTVTRSQIEPYEVKTN